MENDFNEDDVLSGLDVSRQKWYKIYESAMNHIGISPEMTKEIDKETGNIINISDYRKNDPIESDVEEVPIDEAVIELLNNLCLNVAHLDKKICDLEQNIDLLLKYTSTKMEG